MSNPTAASGSRLRAGACSSPQRPLASIFHPSLVLFDVS
uniref:Uncharacterized protein n=1 Tax=Musa acuminata subsp. malaccensis TaxID=214687 RepID=A0A804JYY3_MUSAM